MKRPLNPIQLEELRFKYEWCKTLQEYYNTLENDCFDIGLMQELDPAYARKNASLHDYLIRIIDKAFSDQNLPGLKCLYNDLNENSRDLSPEQFDELNHILRRKFGQDLVHNRQKEIAEIKRIIKRGKINNEEEYRLIRGWIDELLMNNGALKEVQKLEELLCHFEESV